jgi:hypothetical protein
LMWSLSFSLFLSFLFRLSEYQYASIIKHHLVLSSYYFWNIQDLFIYWNKDKIKPNTVSLYPWVPYPWIQPLQIKNMWEKGCICTKYIEFLWCRGHTLYHWATYTQPLQISLLS